MEEEDDDDMTLVFAPPQPNLDINPNLNELDPTLNLDLTPNPINLDLDLDLDPELDPELDLDIEYAEEIEKPVDDVDEILADQFDAITFEDKTKEVLRLTFGSLEDELDIRQSYSDMGRLGVEDQASERVADIGAANILLLKTLLKKKGHKTEKVDEILQQYYEKIAHLNPSILKACLSAAKPQKLTFEEVRYSRLIEKIERLLYGK